MALTLAAVTPIVTVGALVRATFHPNVGQSLGDVAWPLAPVAASDAIVARMQPMICSRIVLPCEYGGDGVGAAARPMNYG
jgi:hypothetical protein